MGLINDNMARPTEQNDISPESVRSDMKIPPELQNAYERVVVAGMKVMFSKETNKYVLKALESGGSNADKLGTGVAELLLMLFAQSNKTMPPQVMIPAGTELVVQAADFVKQAGLMKVTNQDIGDGIQVMIQLVLKAFGADPQKLFQKIGQFDASQVPQILNQQQGQPQAKQPQQPQQGV